MQVEMNPKGLVELSFRRRKLFLSVFGFFFALYIAAMLLLPNRYESDASLYGKIADSDVATPDLVAQQQARGATQLTTMSEALLNSVLLTFKSEDVLRGALDRLGVETVYPGTTRKANAKHIPPVILGSAKLVKDIEVKVSANTNVILVSVLNKDPEIAQKILQSLIDIAIEKQADVTRSPRLAFLEGKLASIQAASEQAQKDLQEFKTQTRIFSIDSERDLLLKQRDAIQADKNQAEADLVNAESRLGITQRGLNSTPDSIPLSDENDKTVRQMDDARSRLASAEADYNAARLRFAEGNPQLVDAQAQFDAAKKMYDELGSESASRVRSGANPLYEKLKEDEAASRSDLGAAQASMNQREEQLQNINERLAFLDQNQTKMNDLQHRVDAVDEQFRSYLDRAGSAQIMKDMNLAGISTLSVLQTPTLPYKPAQPKRLLMFVLIVFIGFIAALGLCIAVETASETIAHPSQVTSATNLPLLATVGFQTNES